MDAMRRQLRDRIRGMTRQAAKALLSEALPEREYMAIYYADVEQRALMDVADVLRCTESGVKKLRIRGYARLAGLPDA